MKRLLFPAVLFVLILLAFFIPQRAKAAEAASAPTTETVAATKASAGQTVAAFYQVLETTMKEGEQLGFEGRYKKLEPAVSRAFNLPLMARYAVGPAWAKATPEQQKQLVDAFSAFSVATYASRFTKFDGETFEVKGENPSPRGAMVVTHLTPKNSSPVLLNYMVTPDEEGTPRIVDVYLDASISELATRRAEFTAVIKREGLPALIEALKAKQTTMASRS